MVYFFILSSVFSGVIAQSIFKLLSQSRPVIAVLNAMFFLAVFFALIISLLFGTGVNVNILVVVMGFFNAFAAWLFFKGIKINLTQGILFLPLGGFIGVLLSTLFLGEWKLLDPSSISGLLTIVGVIGSLGAMSFFGTSKTKARYIKKIWVLCIIGQTLINGFIYFLVKYIAMQNVAKPTYVLSWYLGAFVGAVAIRLVINNWKEMFPPRNYVLYIILSITLLISLVTYYLALQLAPATLVVPFSQFLNILVGSLAGLFIFQERKFFDRREWWGILIGVSSLIFLIAGTNSIF